MCRAVLWSVLSPAAADGCFKVDLKGVLYTATVLPLVGTALVANMGPTEAKVRRCGGFAWLVAPWRACPLCTTPGSAWKALLMCADVCVSPLPPSLCLSLSVCVRVCPG